MPDVALFVAGEVFTGWEEVQVSRSLEAVSGGFDLRVSSRDAWPIPPGARARLELEGEPVIDGHVDSLDVQFSSAAHTVSVRGRDRTAELVDCSTMHEPGEWLNADLARVVADIANPFGVSLAMEVDPGDPFTLFGTQPGETAWEAIERACRLRGVLATTDGTGRLVLTRPGVERAEVELALGANILSAQLLLDQAERFRRYVVRGQAPGSDDALDGPMLAPQGEATDELARSTRTLLILSEGITTPEQAAERAAWEATFRAARAARLTVTVQGWRQRAGGSLWRPNLIVPLLAPRLGVSGEFLIAGVTYALSLEGGTTTQLELRRPDAFTPQPILPGEGDPYRAVMARHGLSLELQEDED